MFPEIAFKVVFKKTPRGTTSHPADPATKVSTSSPPRQALLGLAVGFLSYHGKNVIKKSRREGGICWLWGEEALFSVVDEILLKIPNLVASLLFSLLLSVSACDIPVWLYVES